MVNSGGGDGEGAAHGGGGGAGLLVALFLRLPEAVGADAVGDYLEVVGAGKGGGGGS